MGNRAKFSFADWRISFFMASEGPSLEQLNLVRLANILICLSRAKLPEVTKN